MCHVRMEFELFDGVELFVLIFHVALAVGLP
jgi:hypothetical protein